MNDAKAFHLIFMLLPLLMATIHCIWKRNAPGFSKADCFLSYFLILITGIQSLIIGYYDLFEPQLVIKYTALPPELAFAHISFGILGILSYWCRQGWRAATAIGYSSYLLMTAFSHIRATGFTSSDPAFWADLPVALFLLFLLIIRKI